MNTTERIAEVAHDLWCERMAGNGWVLGTTYDAKAKRHDALVPFSQISKHDRRQALLAVEAEGLEAQLREAIRYERGPARFLTLEEMHHGLRVGINTEGVDKVANPPPEPGTIVAWEADDDGWLSSVTVLWPDGVRSVHHPAERELRRFDECRSWKPPADPRD